MWSSAWEEKKRNRDTSSQISCVSVQMRFNIADFDKNTISARKMLKLQEKINFKVNT